MNNKFDVNGKPFLNFSGYPNAENGILLEPLKFCLMRCPCAPKKMF